MCELLNWDVKCVIAVCLIEMGETTKNKRKILKVALNVMQYKYLILIFLKSWERRSEWGRMYVTLEETKVEWNGEKEIRRQGEGGRDILFIMFYMFVCMNISCIF